MFGLRPSFYFRQRVCAQASRQAFRVRQCPQRMYARRPTTSIVLATPQNHIPGTEAQL
jgi:hypothetical protein